MSEKDGGPAFPGMEYSGMMQVAPDGSAIPLPDGSCPGMSLRDYFAAQALAGLFHAYAVRRLYIDGEAEGIAKNAYEMADAMLAEREKE